jgi:hypothetical protein
MSVAAVNARMPAAAGRFVLLVYAFTATIRRPTVPEG